MELHRLKLTTTSGVGRTAAVELDGQRIEGALRGVDIRLSVDEFNSATLKLYAPVVEFEGETEIHLPEDTQTLLKRLGWTPPD